MPHYFDDPLVDIAAHRLETSPAGTSSSLLGFPTQLVTAACSCGSWRSDKRWEISAHFELYDQHMHEVQEHAHSTARLAQRLTPLQLQLLSLVQNGALKATAGGHSFSSLTEQVPEASCVSASLERLATDKWIALRPGEDAALTTEGRIALLSHQTG